MRKIHITMVGREQMPIYQGIVETSPDKVILFYSEDSVEQKEGILRVFTEGDNKVECESIIIEAFNCHNVEKTFLEIVQMYKDEDVSVNISGGTKIWTYYAISCFSKITNNLFYIDQNSTLWSFKDNSYKSVNYDLCAMFDMNQWPVEGYKFLDDYSDEDFEDIKTIESLWLKNKKAIAELGELLVKNGRYCECSCDGASLAWDDIDEQYRIQLYNRIEYLKSKKAFDLFTNTSWFEVKIAKLLKGWPHAQNIIINCVFKSKKGKKDNDNKNEIDIIVETDKKSFFIECKTKIKTITDIDKFSKATRNFGGSGSKAIFIQYDPIEDIVLEKIKDNGIKGISLSDYRNINMAKEELYQLLDKEYGKSNI